MNSIPLYHLPFALSLAATAAEKAAVSIDHSGFVARMIAATKTRPADVDWPLAFATARAGRGLPVRISR